MGRILLTIIFTFILQSASIFAQNYAVGDIIKEKGITYKVLSTYLVIDSKESPDTITGPDKFYQSGELMVTEVDEGLIDVVIPTSVGRFLVIGLTDSLFYNHEHNRIWLPDLMFAGNGCFAKLKVGSRALVVHNIIEYGYGIFDRLDADLIFDITKPVSLASAFRKDTTVISTITQKPIRTYTKSMPLGAIKMNTRRLKNDRYKNIVPYCYTTTGKNYTQWLDKAFTNDKSFQKNDISDKNLLHSRRAYTTTPRGNNKGFVITASTTNRKEFQNGNLPWGHLTKNYSRITKYSVINKRNRKNVNYDAFVPVADATQKGGWIIKIKNEYGEAYYTLNGKKIK